MLLGVPGLYKGRYLLEFVMDKSILLYSKFIKEESFQLALKGLISKFSEMFTLLTFATFYFLIIVILSQEENDIKLK